MKNILLVICINMCLKTFSQNVFKHYINDNVIKFESCKLIPFVWDDGRHEIQFNHETNLNDYFIKFISTESHKTMRGVIGIQILISSDGKACCNSVYKKWGNFSIEQMDTLQLDQIVNNMPIWQITKPSKTNNIPDNYSIRLILEITKHDISIDVDNTQVKFLK